MHHRYDGERDTLLQEGSCLSLKKIRQQRIAEVETQVILGVLELTRWNRRKAAQLLQIDSSDLKDFQCLEFNVLIHDEGVDGFELFFSKE